MVLDLRELWFVRCFVSLFSVQSRCIYTFHLVEHPIESLIGKYSLVVVYTQYPMCTGVSQWY